MEYIYAAMLLHKAGKPIDEDSLTKVLEAAGVNVDPVRVKALVAALSEIDIDVYVAKKETLMKITISTRTKFCILHLNLNCSSSGVAIISANSITMVIPPAYTTN